MPATNFFEMKHIAMRSSMYVVGQENSTAEQLYQGNGNALPTILKAPE
jgi:hypothetical protein